MKNRIIAALAAVALLSLTGCTKEPGPEVNPPLAAQPIEHPARIIVMINDELYGVFPDTEIKRDGNIVTLPSCKPVLGKVLDGCAAAAGHATPRTTQANDIEIGLPELGSVCRMQWPQGTSWDCGYDVFEPQFFTDWKCTTVAKRHDDIDGDGKSTKKDAQLCFRSAPPPEVADELLKTFTSEHYAATRATPHITTRLGGGEQSGFTPSEGWRQVNPAAATAPATGKASAKPIPQPTGITSGYATWNEPAPRYATPSWPRDPKEKCVKPKYTCSHRPVYREL